MQICLLRWTGRGRGGGVGVSAPGLSLSGSDGGPPDSRREGVREQLFQQGRGQREKKRTRSTSTGLALNVGTNEPTVFVKMQGRQLDDEG